MMSNSRSMSGSGEQDTNSTSQYAHRHSETVSEALLQAAARMSAQESSESPPDAHDEDPNDAPTKRQKRSRACQACRSMKIRCNPVEGQEACKACAKVNRACIMPGPARKRQKTVHKVAELEKKIDALTASLGQKNKDATAPTPPTDSPLTTSTPSTKKVDKEYNIERIVDREFAELPDAQPRDMSVDRESSVDDYEDVVTRGVVDIATATRTYEHWRDNMCPYCPVVAFSKKVTVDWLRTKRPMTLLAILVIGAGATMPEQQADLGVEMARQLADRVMYYNEKSLDLVHSMLIYSTWYGKHKYARDLGFNHYIHSAVAMCLDLGLDAEVRRTWMGCYYMAGSVSTVLRFPALVKYSAYIEECLDSLANNKSALPSDHFLCCLVKLTHLVQDVGRLFHMDDPGSTVRLNDDSTQYQLELFERRLEDWKNETKKHLPDRVMMQYDAVVSLYIHEIALHNEHNVDDFRPMYRPTGRETWNATKDFFTNDHFKSLTICVESMRRAMKAFIEMDETVLRGVPSIHVVWTAYVAIAMIRLHGILTIPGSMYGPTFLPKLNVVGYLDACVQKLVTTVGNAAHVPAEGFIIAFQKLRAWHIYRTNQHNQENGGAGSKNPIGGLYSKTADTEKAGFMQNPAAMPSCQGPQAGLQSPNTNTSTTGPNSANPHGSPLDQQMQYQAQQLPQFTQFGQPIMQPPQKFGSTSSILLDENAPPIDASTFDVNWDFAVGELDNFENYLGDAGWMGYLM